MLNNVIQKPVRPVLALSILLTSLLPLATTGNSSLAQTSAFADPAFGRLWQRTDLPVARGAVARTWFWGPQPGQAMQETYRAPDGSVATHRVQYFDKSRMEINDPSANPGSPWYVTNGLLAVEMIAGLPSLGGASPQQPLPPADIPLASDLSDPTAPTYRTFRAVADVPGNEGHQATPSVGRAATATINRSGQVGSDPSKASLGGPVQYAYFEPGTRHNIVAAFWDFLNSTGPVYEDGQIRVGRLSLPWFFATGYPISEAYWSKASIDGKPHDVLIQAFQRRVLTYLPDNPPGWQVQMSNIGQHAYLWRYGGGAPQPALTPLTTPQPAPQLTGRIAFASDRISGSFHIFTMAPDGSNLRQVSKTPGNNYSPRYAPDGHYIAYWNAPPAAGPAAVPGATLIAGSAIFFTSDAQGSPGGPMDRTSVPAWDAQSDPAFSPDATFLAFRGKPSGERPGLFVANLASGSLIIPVRRLTTNDWDRQPAWSPDSKQIAFTSGDSADASQIWTINRDGSGRRRLTDAVPGKLDQDSTWSPAGTSLLYTSRIGTAKSDLRSISPDGTSLSPPLAGSSFSLRYPAYSPGGDWLGLSSDSTGNWDIFIAPISGSPFTNLTHSSFTDIQPDWSK